MNITAGVAHIKDGVAKDPAVGRHDLACPRDGVLPAQVDGIYLMV